MNKKRREFIKKFPRYYRIKSDRKDLIEKYPNFEYYRFNSKDILFCKDKKQNIRQVEYEQETLEWCLDGNQAEEIPLSEAVLL